MDERESLERTTEVSFRSRIFTGYVIYIFSVTDHYLNHNKKAAFENTLSAIVASKGNKL